MLANENTWDKLLQIKTTGRDDSNSDQYHYPYEPTPYSVLERLANSGLIRKKMCFWIMDAEKGVWIISFPIRPKQKPLGLNMMNAFIRQH